MPDVKLRSAITLVVVAMASLAGLGAEAGAQEYAGNCVLSVSGAVVPGGQIQVSGSGFEPNFVTVLIFTDANSTEPLGPITVGAAGTFGPLPFTLPASITGSVTLSAVCNSGGQTAVTPLGGQGDRTPTTRAPRGSLPRTGDDTTEMLVTVGALAVVAGTASVLIARRRRAAA
jgi:LPXTG-motif cell wall-anchored protein